MTITCRTDAQQQRLAEALLRNGGNRDWAQWKADAAGEVVRMADRAERMHIHDINLEGDFAISYGIKMPVPQWPVRDQLVIGNEAVFHLLYLEEWRWESPPGWAPIGILYPHDVFHPNLRPAARGALCLGQLAPSTAPKELILLGYYSLALLDYALDETDPHGVLNVHACEYYRHHPEHLPLTRAGLFEPWSPMEQS